MAADFIAMLITVVTLTHIGLLVALIALSVGATFDLVTIWAGSSWVGGGASPLSFGSKMLLTVFWLVRYAVLALMLYAFDLKSLFIVGESISETALATSLYVLVISIIMFAGFSTMEYDLEKMDEATEAEHAWEYAWYHKE